MNRIWSGDPRSLLRCVVLGIAAAIWLGTTAAAAPVNVEIRSEDLDKVEFGVIASVKIDGVTETHPDADSFGFVTLPADVTMQPGTVQLTAKFGTQATYGPHSVSVVPDKVRAVWADTGVQIGFGGYPTTRIQLRYRAADLDLSAIDQANASIDGRVKVKVTGVTETLPGADINGFVQLPLTIPTVLLVPAAEVSSLVDDVLNFGPDTVLLGHDEVKVLDNSTGTISSGSAPSTQLTLKYDTSALPILDVTGIDLEDDPVTTRGRIKIVGHTESLPGADLDGFVALPVTIANITTGSYSVSAKLDGSIIGGPYNVGITLGDQKEIKAQDGAPNSSGPSSATELVLEFGLADLALVAQDQTGAAITDGSVTTSIPGITTGFVSLPDVGAKVRIGSFDITWKLNGLLTFGPFTTSVIFGNARILNPDVTEFGNGAAAQTSMGLRLDLTALPLLEVRALDLEDDALAVGRASIKIDGVTESLPGADGGGFVDMPIDIADFAAGSYTMTVRLDGSIVGGPYSVEVALGDLKEIKAEDGAPNSAGPSTSTRLVLRYRVADLDLFAQDGAGTPIADGSVEAKIPGVTETMPGADVNGFIPLPVVASKILITQVDITWTYNDLLTFGPFSIGIDGFNDVKVMNPDGTTFGTGLGTSTGLGLRLDLAALPLLEVRATDLEDDAVTGRSKIKITGVTETLPGADVNGFVDVPIDIPDVPAGTYTVENSIDGAVPYGPYPVEIILGNLKKIKAFDGSGITSGTFGSTRLELQYRVADLDLFAQDGAGTPIADGSVEAKIPGVTETMPGADVNGFIPLPAVASKILITQVDITWTYNDLLTFGPFSIGIDGFNDVKVMNPDGTTFGTGLGTSTGLGLRLDLAALPLLELRAIDFEDDPMTGTRAKIKIDGITETLPEADVNGFVSPPIDIADVPGGTYTLTTTLDDVFSYGPYPVTIELGELKEIKAIDGAASVMSLK